MALRRRDFLAATALSAGALAAPTVIRAQGAAPLRIGFITTLSGPAGYLGEDIRDAFQLHVDQENGRLGGIPVQLVVEDDALRPGQG
jgi:branched-chain amino acid transport system substrate-binding protein